MAVLSRFVNALSGLEAGFRIGFLQRSYRKEKDDVSRCLRELYRRKGVRVSLEEDILNAWQEHSFL